MDLYYLVSMVGYNNKILYLMAGDNDGFKWTKDYNQAVWFPTDYEADRFARGYFRHFKDWSITAINYDGSDLKK